MPRRHPLAERSVTVTCCLVIAERKIGEKVRQARIHRFAASELVSRCARSWVGAEHRSERSLSSVNEERRSQPARWCAWAPGRRRGSVDPG